MTRLNILLFEFIDVLLGKVRLRQGTLAYSSEKFVFKCYMLEILKYYVASECLYGASDFETTPKYEAS